MAIEIKTGARPENLKPGLEGLSASNVGQPASGAASATAPVLGGESLKVTSGAMTDLEKLVAKVKSESDDARTDIAKARISSVMALLDSLNVRMTEAQKSAMEGVLEIDAELAANEKELSGLYAKYGITDGDAASAVMDALIESLEKAIERAVQEGEDHRERVEADKEKLKEAQADKARMDELKNSIATASAREAELLATLDGKILASAAAALGARETADAADVPDGASPAEERKRYEKEIANDPMRAIREALALIDEAMSKTIEENKELKA